MPADEPARPTRLDDHRYLELLSVDAARLAEVGARDLDAEVPPCPGWQVRDVVLHTAEVYQHKIACMRLQRAPDPWPPQWDVPDPAAWFRTSLDELTDELVSRGPAAPSYTWWPPDQTVGFWYRRMAQETAVHRVDAESAFDAVTPVDDALAVDGIDEVLHLMVAGDWSDEPVPAGAGRTVAVRTGDHVWRVALAPERVGTDDGPGPADAVVSGEASELLLWLWGRRPLSAVTADGDAELVSGFRERVALATQ